MTRKAQTSPGVVRLWVLLELSASLQKQSNYQHAATELVNALHGTLQVDRVALGRFHRRQMKVTAISGPPADRGSQTVSSLLAVLMECRINKNPTFCSLTDREETGLVQAHRQLAACLQCEAVLSFPLFCDEQFVGGIVLAGTHQQLKSSQSFRFAAVAGPVFGEALDVVRRSQRSRLRRFARRIIRGLGHFKTLALLLILCAAVGSLFIPVTYRVRCECVAEPVLKRFAVAPFEGQIVTAHVRAGDHVQRGQVLAELDGRTIRWQLSGINAQHAQSQRTREMELSGGNIAETLLAELEEERLIAEQSVLEYQQDHLRICSPIDGIVLSGSLDRAEAASVSTGQMLFEIGSLQPLRIELAIPSDEVAQVPHNATVCIHVEGQEDRPIRGKISRICPRSEIRDSRNVFIADVEFANTEKRLRPGMKATARIDCEPRRLGWSLFHKPINALRARLMWW